MEIWYTITGGIDANTAHGLVTWVNAQIYNSNITKLTLFLSSGGGDIDSAIRIHAYLKGLPFETEIIGFSQIDSAANLIFLGGSNRKALKGCRFFLHEGSFNIGNQAAALHVHEETLRVLQELLKRSIEIISKETKKTKDEISSILREGQIYTTQQALDFGIATEIIDKLPNKPNTPNP